MNTNKILSASLIDLIFDGRNKEYGAYYLRKTYEQRIKKSLLVTFSVVALVIGSTALAGSSKRTNDNNIARTEVSLIDLPPDEKLPEPPPPKQEPPPEEVQVKTEKLTEMVVVNKDVIDPPPTQEALVDAKIGDIKIEGIPDIKIAAPEIQKGISVGIIDIKKNVDQDLPIADVQVQAEFNGNWRRFLETNLDSETPTRNNAPAGRYTVVVQFVVDKDGSVSDIKTLTNHGYGLEAEAIRVIKKSPKWKPAIQNGYEVKAYRKQLITFDVLEE